MAAFAVAVTIDGRRTADRIKKMLLYMRRYCDMLKTEGVAFLSKAVFKKLIPKLTL